MIAREELERAARWHVAAVEERVHDDARDVLALGELDERGEMLHVGVDAAGGDEAHEVKRPALAHGGARPQ